jgi:hypothetical protein
MWPLAAGAILLGWAGMPLARLLQNAPKDLAIHAVSMNGLLIGALGMTGFGAAFIWQRATKGHARLASFGIDWVPGAAAASRHLALAFAALHNGRLGLYLFTAVLGVALILLMAFGRMG